MIIAALRDNVAEIFNPALPLFRSEAEAIRAFKAIVNADEPIANVRDLELYVVGTFDDRTGAITGTQKFLANYLSVKETAENE